jgi:uncharacterized membrane-anchored protein
MPTRGRVSISTDATATTPTAKKRLVKKRKTAGVHIAQSVLSIPKKGKGQGEGVGKQSSQYRGVIWNKNRSKWIASITYDGKLHHRGYFEDEEEAARAYDKAARAHHREKAQLNFPTKKEQAEEEAKQQRWIKFGEAGSKYQGVSWAKSTNKWRATISYDGKKRHHLGCFEDEEEAGRVYDKAARAQHGKKAQLNFPAEGESGLRKSSKYRGVSWKKRDAKWVARIAYDSENHRLGCFEDEEEAARTYDRAARTHHGEKAQLNFPRKQLKGGR